MFALRATYHTTLQASPTQLVFGRDAILNTKFVADWHLIRKRKQRIINENNQRKNDKRLAHEYQVGDLILYHVPTTNKYGKSPWQGPYKILRVYDNGTIQVRMGALTDRVNICNIRPYHE